jgi:uncharacterized membrane protein
MPITRKPFRQSILMPLLAMAGCHAASSAPGLPGSAEDHHPFSAIGMDETVRFTGTEPFWGGSVRGEALRYETPDHPAGEMVTVVRFAGRAGLSWTGKLDGARFALAVTEGACSDGMSDRHYPFVATLEVRGEQRSGCAWTDRKPVSGAG